MNQVGFEFDASGRDDTEPSCHGSDFSNWRSWGRPDLFVWDLCVIRVSILGGDRGRVEFSWDSNTGHRLLRNFPTSDISRFFKPILSDKFICDLVCSSAYKISANHNHPRGLCTYGPIEAQHGSLHK